MIQLPITVSEETDDYGTWWVVRIHGREVARRRDRRSAVNAAVAEEISGIIAVHIFHGRAVGWTSESPVLCARCGATPGSLDGHDVLCESCNHEFGAHDLEDRVRNFMEVCDQYTAYEPSVPPPHVSRLRARLILEEAFEFAESLFPDAQAAFRSMRDWAFDAVDRTEPNVDLVAAADAVADLLYVAVGANIAMGIDGKRITDIVHEANCEKAKAGKDPVTGKVLKPSGWVGPEARIRDDLIAQGWEPDGPRGD